MGLSSKQQLFIDEYLICWNATEAARRAGYKGNDVTLASVGYENLRKPQIEEAIRLRLQQSAMEADEVLKRLADMARGDIVDFVKVDRPADLAKEELKGKTHVVRRFKRSIVRGRDGTEYENTELELYDAQAALLNIGKNHGLFTDRQTVMVKVEREMEEVLNILERVLDRETYERVLAALSGEEAGAAEARAVSETETE